MQLTPVIAIHMTAALAATVIGPVALWARRSHAQRPRLHRAAGYAWVTLMAVTALSALFIRSRNLPNLHGFSPIHLLIPVTLFGLFGAFWALARRNITLHKKIMQRVYIGACVVAGAFTLLPSRYLGQLIWGEWLGLLPASAPTSLLAQVLSSTPTWVWALLVALLALGLSQTRPRALSLARATVPSWLMGALSLWGTVSAFGASVPVLACWLLAASGVARATLRTPVPSGTRYDRATQRLHLPGSWTPMALIMGIFLVKYVVGVQLTFHPERATQWAYTLPVAALYGLFSGAFVARATRLLHLTRAAATPAPGVLAAAH